ncbi:helix-turn-helix domain-containing protein [Burkholderia gladioli]
MNRQTAQAQDLPLPDVRSTPSPASKIDPPSSDTGVLAPARPSSSVPALTLQEAADLLSVSYSTVYSRKNELGFFKIGGIWRVWLSDLKDATVRLSEQTQAVAARDDPARSAASIPHPQERSAMLEIQRQYEELTRPRSRQQRKQDQ